MAGQRSAALIVLHDGKLRLERYGLDFDANGRWTSFSVAKSITSTLVGAAVRDGFIKSMDDKVSDYIAEMKGSAYDDVSIRQLLTMTSGLQFSERYDGNDDVTRLARAFEQSGRFSTVVVEGAVVSVDLPTGADAQGAGDAAGNDGARAAADR